MFDDVTAAEVLRFDAAMIEGGVYMGNTILNGEDIALSMQGAAIKNDFQLRPNFRSAGYLLLRGIRIEGLLSLSGAKLTTTDKALNLDNATIQWSVFLRDGFQSAGEIRMIGAEIGGQLDCSGAALAPEGTAFSLNRTLIRGSVLLRSGFKASGEIEMLRTQIDGDLDFEGSAVGPFTGNSMAVGGDLLWRQIAVSDHTSLDLQGARLKRILDDEASWPAQGKLKIIGLSVQDLYPLQNHRLHATARIAWLNLQPKMDLNAPQPWICLAELFAAKGYEKAAGQVRSELRMHQLRTRSADSRFKLFAYIWSTVVTRLGDRAFRNLYILLFLISLGIALYGSGGRSGRIARFVHRSTLSPPGNSLARLHLQPTSPKPEVDRVTPSRSVTTISEFTTPPTVESQSTPGKATTDTSSLKQSASREGPTKTFIDSAPKSGPKPSKKTAAKKLVPHHVKRTHDFH